MTANTVPDLVQARIRGFRITAETIVGKVSTKGTAPINLVRPATTAPTMLTLTHDASDPANIRGRFPLGMNGNRYLPVFPFALLQDAVFSAIPVGQKPEIGEFVRFTPWVEEDFEHGSDEGLTFEFRTQGYGVCKLWMPLDGLNDFVTKVAPRAQLEVDLSDHALEIWLESETG
jgi:hypothetical protein